jgi:hypothetical protein
MSKLSQSTIEQLKSYVYILKDPGTRIPFYVGKGQGDRINNHVKWALEHKLDKSEKIRTIKDILALEKEVELTIVRHGMNGDEAYEVESALIDFIGIEYLTNQVRGHDSAERGLMSVHDIELKYQAEPAEFSSPALLININNSKYDKGLSDEELYEATRKHWVVDINKVRKIPIVCAIFHGLIREVYEVSDWYHSPEEHGVVSKRSYFLGAIATPEIRDKYLDKSIIKYVKKGSQNPIKYVGIID